jgi:hypothetical protein
LAIPTKTVTDPGLSSLVRRDPQSNSSPPASKKPEASVLFFSFFFSHFIKKESSIQYRVKFLSPPPPTYVQNFLHPSIGYHCQIRKPQEPAKVRTKVAAISPLAPRVLPRRGMDWTLATTPHLGKCKKSSAHTYQP